MSGAVGRPNAPLHLASVAGRTLPGAGPEKVAPPKPGLPDKPLQIVRNARASVVWDEYGPRLLRAGYMCDLYGHTFALFCVAVARWQHAEEKLAADGGELVVAVGENGYQQQHPLLSIANKAMEQVATYGAKFGLSPSDIARATATQGDLFGSNANDPASEFFP